MTPDLKEQWVAALRSGEYKQGPGWLRRGDKFCCLGVLCDLVAPEDWTLTGGDEWVGTFVNGGETQTLPEPILNKADLDGFDTRQLVQMNDDGSSFRHIADYIEREL